LSGPRPFQPGAGRHPRPPVPGRPSPVRGRSHRGSASPVFRSAGVAAPARAATPAAGPEFFSRNLYMNTTDAARPVREPGLAPGVRFETWPAGRGLRIGVAILDRPKALNSLDL